MFLSFNVFIFIFGLILYLFITETWAMKSREGKKKQNLIIQSSGKILKIIALGSMAMSLANIAALIYAN